MTILTSYLISFVFFLFVDGCIFKNYKKVGTVLHVIVTVLTIIVIWFLFQYLYPDTYREDVVRVCSMGLLSEIVLYLAICRHNLFKNLKTKND